MKNEPAHITSISKFGRRKGLKIGDELVSFDGHKFVDILDVLFYDAQENFEMVVKRKEKCKKIKIKKKSEQSLGIEIDKELEPIRCKNKCKFCFIDQLPKGMREAMYVKDDDYRFSFISGSYVTTTNMTDEDFERILRLHLSPLYISVHAFDNELRKSLVQNPNTLKLIDNIKMLGAHGIKMHTQMVVVPNLNDGEELEKGIRGLHEIEGVISVAVVPVGLTGHREGLAELRIYNKDEANQTVELVEKLNDEFKNFCWCSDEFYMLAEREVPEYDYYYDFDQIENGVGLIADFKRNLDSSLQLIETQKLSKHFGIVTGEAFAPVIKEEKKKIEKKLGVKIDIFPIKNEFFGETVTVAGLVTATDIIKQMQGIKRDAFFIPSTMLKEFSDVFLDNVSLSELQEKLNAKFVVASELGDDLVEKIIEF